MRVRNRLLAVLVVVLVPVLVVAARAAATSQQQVPEEMVVALVKNMYQAVGTPEPRVLVGQLPADIADLVWLPDGARV